MSLTANLLLAERIIQYVKTVVHTSAKKPDDVIHAATNKGMPRSAVMGKYSAMRIEHDIAYTLASDNSIENWVRLCAEQVHQFGVGNCFEQACVGY